MRRNSSPPAGSSLVGFAGLLLLLGVALLGCGTPIQGGQTVSAVQLAGDLHHRQPATKPRRSMGKFVYQNHCASCHGSIGPELLIPGRQPTPEEASAISQAKEAAVEAKRNLPNPQYPPVQGMYTDLYEYKWYANGTDFGGVVNQSTGQIDRGMNRLNDYRLVDLFNLLSDEPHGSASEKIDYRARLSDSERWAVSYYIGNMALDNGQPDWAENWDQQLALRKNIYGTHCSICHGGVGRGDGPEGQALIPKPMNFNYLDWAVGVKHDAGANIGPDGEVPLYPVTDQYIFDIIANGKIAPGSNTTWTGMPWWKDQLTDDDMWGLVEFIRSLSYEQD